MPRSPSAGAEALFVRRGGADVRFVDPVLAGRGTGDQDAAAPALGEGCLTEAVAGAARTRPPASGPTGSVSSRPDVREPAWPGSAWVTVARRIVDFSMVRRISVEFLSVKRRGAG